MEIHELGIFHIINKPVTSSCCSRHARHDIRSCAAAEPERNCSLNIFLHLGVGLGTYYLNIAPQKGDYELIC